MPHAFTHWGTYDVTVDPAARRVTSVRPVREDPDPSPIGQSLHELADHPVRLRRPAARTGFLEEVASGRRGRDRDRRRGAEPFVELGWDEALDLAAAEIERVRTTFGNESIFAGSYGWASAGRFHNPQTQLFRFLDLLGGFTRSVHSYSYAAAEVILPHVVDNFFAVLANQTSFDQLAANGRLVVALGGLPTKNQQVENGGTFRHLAPSGIRAMREAGLRIVNVSPLRGDVDDELDAEWLPIRPTTDVALLLAVAHTLVVEGLHDTAFLERYCSGVDRFLDHVATTTPDWAEAITGIPAERIRELAHDMAAGPTLLTASWSLQRAEHGEMAYWATIAVAALLGQIGTPGGGFGLGYGSVNRIGSAESAFSLARLPVGRNPVKTFIPVARITELLSDPGGTVTYDGGLLTLPDTRLVYWCGGNPFHHHQDLNRLVQAWQQPECVIVHEQAWTPLARHADLVFPVATTLERTDIGSSPLTGAVVAMAKLLDPPGEARTDHATFAALAERFGMADAFTEGLDEAGWLARLWAETGDRARQWGFELPTLEELFTAGVASFPRPERPRVLLEAFRADPDATPLPTPSGRIELHSAVLEAFELADCPPLPSWVEPVEWLGSPLAAQFPLHLLSNQPATRLHSQLDYGRTSVDAKIRGREALRLHPDDAAARGVSDGDVVRVFNDRGACLAGVATDDGLHRGVVVLPTGAWFDPIEPGGMCVHGNPNVLTSDRPTSSLTGAPAAQSCLVEVERWDGELPPIRVHTPPPFVER